MAVAAGLRGQEGRGGKDEGVDLETEFGGEEEDWGEGFGGCGDGGGGRGWGGHFGFVRYVFMFRCIGGT